MYYIPFENMANDTAN